MSALSLASILKHVSDTEAGWIAFARTGVLPGAEGWDGEDTRFVLADDDTVEALLARYDPVAAETAAFIAEADRKSTRLNSSH